MNFESFPKPYCFLQNNSTENLSFHLATVSNEINQKYAMGG